MIDKYIEQGIRAKDSPTVLVKPNMVVTNTQLAATHVDALQALLEYLQKFDNIQKIIVGEGSAGSPTQEGFSNYGYLKLAEKYPIEFMDLNKDSYITAPVYQIEGEDINVRIARTPLECDYKISITVPKTHETVIFTGATKNYIMGSVIRNETDDKIKVHGFQDRTQWDQYYTRAVKLMHRNLVRLASTITGSKHNRRIRSHGGKRTLQRNTAEAGSSRHRNRPHNNRRSGSKHHGLQPTRHRLPILRR